ncbi:MAG: AMP-binding protein [Hyphomicrobiaceae bacterium]|nr:MAG: AMP-binding protein [Hyphomicrobiaceae bacterium]
MTRWVMVADLERCVGCQTCTAACRHANATSPAVQWRKVLDIEVGTYPQVSRTFVPVGCQQCADPPCMHVCPTGATRQRSDGIVTISHDLCIGCAYCDVACPYQARFKIDAEQFAYGRAAMANEVQRYDSRRLGIAQKCTFCSDRIDDGLANGLTPGIDSQATPACANACIAGALHFGDIDDADSNVSRLLRQHSHFRMHEEIGTEPGFYYIDGKGHEPARGAVNPMVASAQAGKLRSKGVEPWHQQHWDWKAAGNFICGGAGTGLLLSVALANLHQGAFYPLGWLALAMVAVGLFLLLFKIGRPLRAAYVVRQPNRSWMAREAWLAGAFFPSAALAIWLENATLLIAAAFVGALFLFSQAMILKAAKGIPAWRVSRIVPLIVVTGIAEGAGLFLTAAALLPSTELVIASAAAATAMLAALRGWSWRSYVTSLEVEGAPVRSLAVLNAFGPWFFLFGLAVPVTLIFFGSVGGNSGSLLFAVAGACVFAAGAAMKLVLVTRAGFNQGYAVPARGSISGSAVKPGWSLPRTRGGGPMRVQTVAPVPGAFMHDPAAETMPRAELKALQTSRLRKTLENAYANVPHYRRAFDLAGVKPGDFKVLADIARFPFTQKSDLRNNYPFGMFAVPQSKLLRLHASSGTTGKATVVGYTKGDIDRWADLMARSFACAGALPGDIIHNAYGYGLFTGGLGAHYGAERLGCTVVPLSGGGTERQVTLLEDFSANVLCATPSYALNIAEVADAMGVDLRRSPLRLGMFGAEPWSEAMRRDLESKLGIKAIDVYGLSEIMGPGVACECHVEQAGLHGWEDHFLFEIVDPETLQPLPMGATGELVITTLTKEALPMIRYRTRDITRLSDEPCTCGRTHLRIMRVTGRNDDMLIIRGVNVYPSQVEAVLVGLPGLAPHYQLILTREGALDSMTVEVELAPDNLLADAGRARKADEVAHHIKSLIGVTCKVVIKSPGEVPRSQGKAVRIRDLRMRAMA